ncbi:SDR family NAD(P)-dependent oxidoreductase [Legionella maioricensis]|uniref:SDR family NAD(P)-dependent oxidoreductase n=1 Tax=Legionella maioricensis TaxID=2896528 RepID=A0A9X2D0E3_9GAMM|nr:SDR family NAD(P)-dependent oxidoreductase [Legionella maioricensis]MCL9683913.1 SDR family NAD(P)-dependent oxidoreductase [Legionella maioricensis]MCL9689292.1 SDR family NAD(P)-dependent oxidoreductase [Legionella maioricensis]
MFIITGGGSGIGKALALALAKRGKSVLIVGRREQLLEETASFSSLIKYFCADVSTSEGLHSIKTFIDNIPQIEGLVNNAGTIAPLAAIKDIQLEEWHRALNTNLDAPLFLPQILYDKLTNGRVLNIGSAAAYFAVKGWTAYCVSKAALAMLTQCWQLESKSVFFASVKPGIIDTEMQAIIRQGSNMAPEDVDFYKRLKQNNRLITPETAAEFLTWLLLDIDRDTYISQEWDIYDTAHHVDWLRSPHQVLHWEF